MPLINKVSDLAKEHPGIKNYRSSDISPCSWFSVAWYPIYGIPAGSTLNNLNTAFLTFYNLSTHPKSKNQLKLQDESLKMPIPIFGITTYNLEGSILTLPKAAKSDEMNSLLKAADVWLKSLKVELHQDYNFFVKDGKQWVGE
ncbi:hypothetical protein MtrunA17_Chr1g0195091 [Medicago truncatula]|nr:hypothetical protein MtrunA17_Chr1g0195091 [Medicago truncatula]